jgi:DNA repair protein RecO (recombination protein O)
MLSKTRAIALHNVKYGESSLIVTMYTEKYGRLGCIAGSVRSVHKKSRFPANLFQPLTLLEMEIYYKQNREIQRLKEIACPFHFTTLPFSITKSSIALFLAEVLFVTLREEESNPPLFDFLFHSVQLLDSKEEGIQNFHLLFLLHLSRYLGFFPEQLGSHVYGGKLSADLRPFGQLPKEALEALVSMIHVSAGFPEAIRLGNLSRSQILDSLIAYYAMHVEGMNRIKSLQILKDVYS